MRTPTFSWSFLLLIIPSVSLSLEIYGASGQCLSDQQSLLLQLKNSLVFDTAASKFNLVDWNQTTDCCSWDGVSCNEGRVIGLSLSNKSIIAGIHEDSSLFKLRYLKSLDLSFNNFGTSIPSSFGKLPQLVYLNLSFNNFTGPIPSFEMSKNLTELVLSHNSLTGAISSAHLEGLSKLVVLDLQNNLLNGIIPPSLFALPSLEMIQLSYNQFQGQLPDLPNASFSVLRFLDLSSNNFEGSIPLSIFKLGKLSVLSLAFNKLNSTIQLDMIQGLRNLSNLDLSYNNLYFNASGDHTTWSSFPRVSTLKLASCKLRVFPFLMNQPNLFQLDISDNLIQGIVPNWIWGIGNGSLHHLNLSHNSLVGIQEPYSLPPNLDILDLHSNQIRGMIPVPPPFTRYTDFSDNNFTSFIPADIGNNLSGAIFFSVSNNKLTGIIPDSICNATNIQVLDLSNNGLTGTIPSCLIERIDTLGVLNLQGNNFSGSIPDSFSVDCSLRTIDFNANSIEGQVPKSLANCNSLEILNLGSNKIMDEFPCFLMNISTLRVLVLGSNKFYGPIGCASTNGTSSVLQIVDLAHNNFSGKLPIPWLRKSVALIANESDAQTKLNLLNFEFFVSNQPMNYMDAITVTSKGHNMEIHKILTIFTYVDLSSNNFQDSIPEEIGKLQGLYTLNLSNNALTGEIPSSIGNMRILESLDLSRNNLSGTIPTSLGELSFLSYLDLSFNHLFGRIPQSTQLQTFSADSFMGNEGLCGFPLQKTCSNEFVDSVPPNESFFRSGSVKIGWNLIWVLVGFVFGFVLSFEHFVF